MWLKLDEKILISSLQKWTWNTTPNYQNTNEHIFPTKVCERNLRQCLCFIGQIRLSHKAIKAQKVVKPGWGSAKRNTAVFPMIFFVAVFPNVFHNLADQVCDAINQIYLWIWTVSLGKQSDYMDPYHWELHELVLKSHPFSSAQLVWKWTEDVGHSRWNLGPCVDAD